MDFFKLLHGFVKIDTWICLSCYVDLSKLLNVFVNFVTQIFFMYFCSLPNNAKPKFDQDFKAC